MGYVLAVTLLNLAFLFHQTPSGFPLVVVSALFRLGLVVFVFLAVVTAHFSIRNRLCHLPSGDIWGHPYRRQI